MGLAYTLRKKKDPTIIKKFGRVQELDILYNSEDRPVLKENEIIICSTSGQLQPPKGYHWIGGFYLTHLRIIFVGVNSAVDVSVTSSNWERMQEIKYIKSSHIRHYASFLFSEVLSIKKTFLGNHKFLVQFEGQQMKLLFTFDDKAFRRQVESSLNELVTKRN